MYNDDTMISEEKAVEVFSSLMNKKYIEMEVSNVNGNIEEITKQYLNYIGVIPLLHQSHCEMLQLLFLRR